MYFLLLFNTFYKLGQLFIIKLKYHDSFNCSSQVLVSAYGLQANLTKDTCDVHTPGIWPVDEKNTFMVLLCKHV